MSMTDPLGDMLTRIRNGQKAKQQMVLSPVSRLRARVLEVLKREGYIRDFAEINEEGHRNNFRIELKYHEGKPVIQEITRISKPGRRIYTKINELQKFYNGLGISILSTPQGVMSDNEARAANVGGEVLCRVF
ncbi:MAG: 30S ribosomal protein S8 [Alphaproteobacteria bacterium]|nr:30S ribosomal protein S8 [Alphaproteobacteria bacterium]